jgi:hypothetical protein
VSSVFPNISNIAVLIHVHNLCTVLVVPRRTYSQIRVMSKDVKRGTTRTPYFSVTYSWEINVQNVTEGFVIFTGIRKGMLIAGVTCVTDVHVPSAGLRSLVSIVQGDDKIAMINLFSYII